MANDTLSIVKQLRFSERDVARTDAVMASLPLLTSRSQAMRELLRLGLQVAEANGPAVLLAAKDTE